MVPMGGLVGAKGWYAGRCHQACTSELCLRTGLCRCRKLVPCHRTLEERHRQVCRVTPCGGGDKKEGQGVGAFDSGLVRMPILQSNGGSDTRKSKCMPSYLQNFQAASMKQASASHADALEIIEEL